jgi:toxin-antitoxin system PIN domain toxin
VIIPDVNLLVHACNSRAREYPAALSWWEATLGGEATIGLAWIAALGFLRVMTHRGIMENPMPVPEATRRVRQWLRHPRVTILTPGEDHAEILFRLLEDVGVAGNLTTDAHLAALAIEYQAEIASTDADFARFPGLRWFNPLAIKARR